MYSLVRGHQIYPTYHNALWAYKWNLKLLITSIGGMRTSFTSGVDFFLSSLATPRGKLRYPINVNRKVLARKVIIPAFNKHLFYIFVVREDLFSTRGRRTRCNMCCAYERGAGLVIQLC